LTGTLFLRPIRKFRLLTMAGPMARSLADLRDRFRAARDRFLAPYDVFLILAMLMCA
jgi:hypothetical protein